MKNMNDFTKLHDIKAPEELKQKTLAAAREARREQAGTVPQHLAPAPRRGFGMAKRILAAACAFGVILGGTAVWKTRGTGQPAGDAVAEAIAHSFGFMAYAADTGEIIQTGDSKIVFDAAYGGCDDPEKGFFSSCVFKVTGEDIQSVSATMNRGGLYRLKRLDIQENDVAAMHQGTDPRIEGADEVSVAGLPEEDKWWADVSWKLENGFADDYDPDACYGLWAEPKEMDPNEDLREAWHGRVDEFDGAVLTVTVTFTDGTTQTQTMTLHTGKLAVEYLDDHSGPHYTGEVLTDEQAAERGYLYGVYAEIG